MRDGPDNTEDSLTNRDSQHLANVDGSLRSPDLTGKTIGDYLILRRLGRGGMADVYLSRQVSLDRSVAFKVLHADLARDRTYVDRFKREARAAAALVHANIVQIFEVGQHDEIYFIAQEYVPGRNLKQHLLRTGAIAPSLAMEILAGTAQAIQTADEFHVVHRDIKPENIMLSEKGSVKVTDFGLAQVKNDPASQTLTKVGITMGTPLYMSPEQVEGKPLDVRSDIYSIGVTAYHMLSGSPPFEGDNPLTIAVQQVKNNAPRLETIRPDLPQSLCDLVHRMIEKAPEDRPQNAAEILAELKQINIDQDYDLSNIDFRRLPIQRSAIRNSRVWKLQSVMDGTPLPRPGKRLLNAALVIGLSCAGWYGGYYLATAFSPADPLETQETVEAPIPKMDSVDKQYESVYWALYDLEPHQEVSSKEAYWQSVIDYFPIDQSGDAANKTELYHQRALARLGELYLQEKRFEQAEAIYRNFSNLSDMDKHFRANGLLGMAVVLNNRSPEEFVGGVDEQESAIRKLLSDLEPDRNLLTPTLRRYHNQLLIQFPPYRLTQ
jgi:serine/threonine-protein kinase